MHEKCLNIEGFLEKSLKTKYALKSTGESLPGLEMSFNFYYSQTCLKQAVKG